MPTPANIVGIILTKLNNPLVRPLNRKEKILKVLDPIHPAIEMILPPTPFNTPNTPPKSLETPLPKDLNMSNQTTTPTENNLPITPKTDPHTDRPTVKSFGRVVNRKLNTDFSPL